jgi:hypothetical protein
VCALQLVLIWNNTIYWPSRPDGPKLAWPTIHWASPYSCDFHAVGMRSSQGLGIPRPDPDPPLPAHRRPGVMLAGISSFVRSLASSVHYGIALPHIVLQAMSPALSSGRITLPNALFIYNTDDNIVRFGRRSRNLTVPLLSISRLSAEHFNSVEVRMMRAGSR